MTAPHALLSNDAVVVSMSDFARFKRCRKAADLTWHRGLEPLADRTAMANGRTFHAFMEAFSIAQMLHNPRLGTTAELAAYTKEHAHYKAKLQALKEALQLVADDPMRVVAEQYIARRWNIQPEGIVSIEEPYYTQVLAPGEYYGNNYRRDGKVSPAVWLRTTFDLIFKDPNAWVVGLDWKTFQKASSLDVDLDFQGKIESAVLQRHFRTDRARFEWRNIRQTPPEVVKDASGGQWSEDECYNTIEMYCSKAELDMLWDETRNVARDILHCVEESEHNPTVWYRVDLKGNSPHTCGQCFVKDLCKSEAMNGSLDKETIAQFAKPRDYINTTLPDGTTVLAERPRGYEREKVSV